MRKQTYAARKRPLEAHMGFCEGREESWKASCRKRRHFYRALKNVQEFAKERRRKRRRKKGNRNGRGRRRRR